MKKALSLFLAVLLIGTMFAGCGPKADKKEESKEQTTQKEQPKPEEKQPEKQAEKQPEQKQEAPAEKKGLRVASHNAMIEGNPYRAVYETQIAAAAQKAKEMGLISQFDSFVANNDPALEAQQIEQSINEGYDIIIVNPIAASGLDALIQKAADAGITYINADCIYDSDKILNVVVDQAAWAEIQADYVIKTLGKGAKVVQFNGIDGNSASEIRSEVWKKKLPEAGIEIVKTVAHNWSDIEAKQLMNEIIASGLEFDGIINQEGANGIMDAIEESKIDFPKCITSSEEVSWIRRIAKVNEDKEAFPFIVVENPPGIGATALAIAINIRQGHELDPGKMSGNNLIYYTPQWIMTHENQKERLESIADLPDSTSVSSFMSVEEAKAAYFK
ncbi:hypothetical protein EII17_09205 [Clostridiales bacterium COT073_COT-073]|nr:hypothetical protein EII17_09205 [Clostridiales bacterium COT073_COT-073]